MILNFVLIQRHSEFNGAACSDNDNTDSCQRSVKKGFESDKSKCINLYKVSHYNYDNKEFYTLISDVAERNSKYNKSGIQNKFVDASTELLKMACSENLYLVMLHLRMRKKM